MDRQIAFCLHGGHAVPQCPLHTGICPVYNHFCKHRKLLYLVLCTQVTLYRSAPSKQAYSSTATLRARVKNAVMQLVREASAYCEALQAACLSEGR